MACKVPALKGKTLAAAKKALKKANCAVGTVTNKPSSKVAKGKVISSKPEGREPSTRPGPRSR